MAYPGDPSGPTAKGAGSFVSGRLTTDDFEQLATAFRPSWEFDEAPFTGPGSLSPADLRALQGGGTHADVRAATQAANGARPVPKAAAPPAVVEESIIVAPAVVEPVVQPAVPSRPPPPPPVTLAAPVVALPPSPERQAQTRIIQRPVVRPVPVPVESTGSLDVPFARRSKKPLWIGVGVGVAALAAIGIWAGSGGTQSAQQPVAATIVKTVEQAPTADIPPPPPVVTPPAVTAPPAPTPRTVSISALAQVPSPTPVAPPRPSPPPVAAPAPAPRPVAAPPAPRPAPRPSPKAAGGTIVHDVPF
jgi:hypothetical protein